MKPKEGGGGEKESDWWMKPEKTVSSPGWSKLVDKTDVRG